MFSELFIGMLLLVAILPIIFLVLFFIVFVLEKLKILPLKNNDGICK